MVLRFGIILNIDPHSIGQIPISEGIKAQSLDGAKDVVFSYFFTKMGFVYQS